ncbi:MAG TPA: helix-turn-helix domain-containing protein [Candidatus Baltobacteraceae bacterium]|nr:helix-turn-helix domain-containing protein [Candidatus Baltobacteraceae bacterium]
MVKRKRHELAAEAARRNREVLARLGSEVRESRLRRRMTQARLGERVGLARSTVGAIERGLGGSHTLDAWQRIGLALDRPLRVELSRDVREEPADAGHLAIQELVIRVGRGAGFPGMFELPTRPSNPAHSTDVGLRDDRGRRLILVECWNTIGDVGAAVRSTNRKRAEVEGLAAVIGGGRPAAARGPQLDGPDVPGEPYDVATVWVVRATRRNRDLVARYPELFASRFTGSSRAWVRALTTGSAPPSDLGLVWCDVRCTRLYAWRRG